MAKILLIVYDNGSHIPFFPQSIFALYSALKAQGGHTIATWHQDLHHGEASNLTGILDKNDFDIVGLGFVAGYWQYQKAKEIAHGINSSKRRNRINFVLGGHGPAAEPAYFMDVLEADTVVVGDGETAICDIAGGNQIGSNPSTSWFQGVIQGTPCNDNGLDYNNYNDFPIHTYRLIRWPTSKPTDFCFPILSSRGCKWACSFCYRMRDGFHQRPVESIVEEITYLHQVHDINHFQFSDELLMASEARTEEICKAILKLPFRIKWDCNGRLNYAKPPILKLMRSAGCEYINYGIESMNQDLLNQMHKGLTVDQINEGIQATLKADIAPGLNLIWGFPGDTVDNLQAAVEFLKKYDPCHELRTIRPVTPYPGTKLFDIAVTNSLLTGVEDFYEHKHINSDLLTVNFMDIDTKEAHKALWHANNSLYANYIQKRQLKQLEATCALYMHGDTSFRGFRDV